jgi:predicted AlkP superfamily pyrophosphatase or phosphodiesterase
MYTGAQPEVHGIRKYEKPVISIDTIFDALLRAGKKPVIIAYGNCSLSKIFLERNMDYYILGSIAEVNAKAAQLIVEVKYDFILTYNANFDDTLHKKGPEHPDTLGEMYFNFKTFCMFDQMIRNLWGKHNVLVGTGMDHGCHLREDGRGVHGANIPEDRNIVHFYKIYPRKNDK